MFRFLPLITVSDITNKIYDAIVKPITDAVGSVISYVLGKVINEALTPALKILFTSLVEPILSLIGEVLLSFIHIRTYYWYVAILRVIDVLEYAFNIFSGISEVEVMQDGVRSKDFLLNVFFTNSGISKVFWSITLLAFAVSLVFGIIAVMKSSIDLDGKRPVGKVLGTIGKAGITFLIVPFFTVFALNMTNIVIKKTNEILSMSVGMDTPSMGTVLFLATTLEAGEPSNETAGTENGEETVEASTDEPLSPPVRAPGDEPIDEPLSPPVQAPVDEPTDEPLSPPVQAPVDDEPVDDENENKNKNKTETLADFTEGIRADYYSGKKNYWDAETVMSDFNIAQVNTVLGLFMSLFVALMLIICAFVFITRIFEVLLLYVASPFFVATIPLDDGAKFDEWKNMFIAKLFSGFGILIGMKLYTILVPIIMSSNLILSSTNFVNMGLKVMFIVGGAFAIYKSNSLLMQIFNIQASYGESATMQAGLGFVLSAKNMGMSALKGMMPTPSGGGAKRAAGASGGNSNPNLGNSTRASGGRSGIEIGAHRRSAGTNSGRGNIEIGSHRRKPWESANVSAGATRNANVEIGGHRPVWKDAKVSDNTTRNSNVELGSHRPVWKGAKASDNTTRNSNVELGVQRRNHAVWQRGVVNKPQTTETEKKRPASQQSTWKKAAPKEKKKDE